MAFTVEHFHELTRLLYERPEWRAELRSILLTEEILNMPRLLSELTAAQQRTEESLQRLEARVEQLAEAQQRTEEGLQRLEVSVDQLAAAQQRTEEGLQRLEARVDQLAAAQQRTEEGLQRLEARVDQLAAAQQRTEEGLQRLEARVDQLAAAQQRTEESLQRLETRVEQLAAAQQRTETRLEALTNNVGDLKGILLESQHRDRPYQHFRGIVLKARTVTIDELGLLTDAALEKALLTEAEAEDIELADAVVKGRDRQTRQPLHLVIESSWGIGVGAVKRAARRAALLAKTGTVARPVAAGKWAAPDAHSTADELKVWLVINGHALAPGLNN